MKLFVSNSIPYLWISFLKLYVNKWTDPGPESSQVNWGSEVVHSRSNFVICDQVGSILLSNSVGLLRHSSRCFRTEVNWGYSSVFLVLRNYGKLKICLIVPICLTATRFAIYEYFALQISIWMTAESRVVARPLYLRTNVQNLYLLAFRSVNCAENALLHSQKLKATEHSGTIGSVSWKSNHLQRN
jgi:hypothetical protein